MTYSTCFTVWRLDDSRNLSSQSPSDIPDTIFLTRIGCAVVERPDREVYFETARRHLICPSCVAVNPGPLPKQCRSTQGHYTARQAFAPTVDTHVTSGRLDVSLQDVMWKRNEEKCVLMQHFSSLATCDWTKTVRLRRTVEPDFRPRSSVTWCCLPSSWLPTFLTVRKRVSWLLHATRLTASSGHRSKQLRLPNRVWRRVQPSAFSIRRVETHMLLEVRRFLRAVSC